MREGSFTPLAAPATQSSLSQILVPVIAGVLAHDGLHRGVGLERRCIDADRLAPQKAVLVEDAEN
ncbi:MAG: hypothetical protein KAX37_03935 [Opitutaceae bacterium]|nr:hypothetical protein [Opitutaceae bacterium]